MGGGKLKFDKFAPPRPSRINLDRRTVERIRSKIKNVLAIILKLLGISVSGPLMVMFYIKPSNFGYIHNKMHKIFQKDIIV